MKSQSLPLTYMNWYVNNVILIKKTIADVRIVVKKSCIVVIYALDFINLSKYEVYITKIKRTKSNCTVS